MQPIFSPRFRMFCLLRDERGIVLSIALIVIVVVAGIGISSQYSGYTNLLTSSNLKMAAKATLTAETGVEEALYRLSRQVGQPGAIALDLTDPIWNDPNWQVEIDFTTGDTDPTDGAVSTIQPAGDWPAQQPANPVIMRYKKPDPAGAPNNVLFYDRTINPPFLTRTLPAPAAPAAGFIPDTAHPVIQILSTGFDERGAERHVSAEVAYSVSMPPPGALSSGVDVDMSGSGFIDGANHSPHIQLSDIAGDAVLYGNVGGETTRSIAGLENSPDDSTMNPDPAIPGGYSVLPRIFNMQINDSGGLPPATEAAFVGLTWNTVTSQWNGTNLNAVSAIALEDGPTLLDPVWIGGGAVLDKGLFTWAANSGKLLTPAVPPLDQDPPFPTPCIGIPPNPPPLICRPPDLTPFPNFQEFLGLGDVAFQKMLDTADTTRADIVAGDPPLGFTFIDGDYIFNNTATMPPDGEFGLMYVRGNLRFNGNARFKGVIFVDGDLDTTGFNYFLGALMVLGITETDATGNFTLLYSRKAAEWGLQAGHPWRVLSWADTELQN